MTGPSCAGKSTYIRKLRAEAAVRGESLDLHYAFEVTENGGRIPDGPRDVVHVNLLRGYKSSRRRRSVRTVDIVPALVEAAEEVVVVVAPRSVLKARAAGRSRLEPDDERYADRGFDAEGWGQVLDTPRLAQVYEQLALLLDSVGVPHRYLCSHDVGHEAFHEISRWELPGLAGPEAEQRCSDGHRLTLPDLGRTIPGNGHVAASGSMRAATLGRILEMPLNGKSVLDIGCADGAASLSAARMGAQVTGLEPRTHGLSKAQAIADATGLTLELRNTTLAEFEAPAAAFDVVLALDVLDQVPDPIAFLERAARLTSSHLVLGYSVADDPDRARPGDHHLSASGLERHLVDHLGAFRHHEVIPTSTSDRGISVFSGKKRKPRARVPVAPEPIPEPVPAPLRRVSDRMRWAVRGVRAGRAEDVLV